MFGIDKLLGIPLGWIMYGIYKLVNDYGVSIILFTLLVRILMLPISYKQQLGTIRTQALNPKLNKLRKQYANNQQKLQEEQQKLYAEEGVNPMGSCLPMIITMIVLYGIIDVVYRPLTHILRISSSFISKAEEVIVNAHPDTKFTSRKELDILHMVQAEPDLFKGIGPHGAETVNKIVEFKNTFLGIDLGTVPSIKHFNIAWLVPIISGLAQLISMIYSQRRSKKMNPDAAKMQGAGCMNAMLYGMPIFSVVLAFTVPAGVGFYWIWSSVFSFIIMVLIYAYLTPKRVEAINAKIKKNNKKKPGLMQRMLEQQSEMLNAQGGRPDYDADTEGMSRSERQNYNRQLINEARKRMAEKYGDEYKEDDDN